jgi:glycoprotein 3-alpha-L-fucosyltransferase
MQPKLIFQWFFLVTSKKTKNYAEGKTKLVAMIASHCPTYNRRLDFVRKLQQFIPVDVFGSCGPHKCDRAHCLSNVQRDYKFYLAFENANCRDYITEKLFRNALSGDIIPIVLGAHPVDYAYAAPPHSYIHVEDFPSPKELADYLELLDRNDSLYNSYFEWKWTGEVMSGFSDTLCRVCAMLFYNDLFPQKEKWPEDAYSWLKVNPCLKPGQHYWRSGELANT